MYRLEANMNQVSELDVVEILDEDLTDDSDPISVTFASGIHESDLMTHLERASRLTGEVC